MTQAQLIQVSASLCVLIPFVLVQVGKLAPSGRTYLIANFIGSGILAVDGAAGHDWGFLLLEGVWCVVSLAALIRTFTRADAPAPRPPSHPRALPADGDVTHGGCACDCHRSFTS